jgi:prepilin-type N-terminal cleavage/methylation domain-containing protein
MTHAHSNRGFTLIELLVVIAIIGILASVVLASLNSARDKGSDAAIKSNLNNARAQAELYYSNQSPNGYTSVCTDAGGITTMYTAASNANGSGGQNCHNGTDGWAANAQLVANTAQYYCVDYTGVATTTSTNTLGGGSTDYLCSS